MSSIEVNFFSNSHKLNHHSVYFVSRQKKQLSILLVNVYVHNIYRIKFTSSFQPILIPLMLHRRVPFLDLQINNTVE